MNDVLTRLGEGDPIDTFNELFARAKETEAFPASRCVIATVRDGAPSARFILVKQVDHTGFTFFTNYGSRKARDLDRDPRTALCFHWHTLGVQVRVEGVAARASAEVSDAYFATRSRASQLGAWASYQSEPLESREVLVEAAATFAERFPDQVPRPAFWGGYVITPHLIELWRDGEHRLHDRFVFTRAGDGYEVTRLSP